MISKHRKRFPKHRKRSPEYRKRSPKHRKRSPKCRKRFPKHRKRFPKCRKRFPKYRKRSPKHRKRSPEHRKRFPKYRKRFPEAWVTGFYEPMIKSNGNTAVKSWMEHQVYLSLGYFLSACISMGLDATPMEGIDKKAYKQILPQDGYAPLFAVTVGYADKTDMTHPSVLPKSRFALDEVVQSI